MKYFPIIIIFYSIAAISQETGINDLKSILKKTNNDSIKIKTCLDIAYSYIYTKTDSTFYYCELAKSLAEKSDNKIEKANAINIEAIAYLSLGKYGNTITFAKQAISIAEELSKEVRESSPVKQRLIVYYNTLANAFNMLSNYSAAIENYLIAARYAESIQADYYLSVIYGNIGMVYNEWDNLKLSMEYYRKTLSLASKTDNESQVATCFINMGAAYFDHKQYDSAYYYYVKALPLLRSLDRNDILITAQINLAQIYTVKKQFSEAGKKLQQVFEIIQSSDFARSKIYYYNALAELQYAKGEKRKSMATYQKAFSVADSIGEKTMMRKILGILSEKNAEAGDYKTAYLNSQLYRQINDSIYSEESTRKIAEMQAIFDLEKSNLEIKQLKEIQSSDRKIKTLLLALIFALVIAFVIILYGVVQKRKRIKAEKELLRSENEKIDKELQYQSRQLASQALMMMQKNNLLRDLQKSVEEVYKIKDADEMKGHLQKLKRQILRSLRSEKDWEVFKMYFEQVNKTFFDKLTRLAPGLNQYDKRIASLIKLRLNIKESASVLNLSPQSVKGARHRLRKKLGLSSSDDLTEFIGNIE